VNTEPLTALLDKMRGGDIQAAERLFLAHEPELRLLVRRRLSRRLRAKFDSLDVIQSVCAHVLRDFRGSNHRIASLDHLRKFLVRVAHNCLIDRLRHYRTALACERPLAEATAVTGLFSREPRASEVARANELWESLLAACPPEHHELLRLKRQGLPLADIAARTAMHEDSVRQIIRKLARKLALSDAFARYTKGGPS
jgi:RNA polymerase sigma-70 factor (ECF subfamily)